MGEVLGQNAAETLNVVAPVPVQFAAYAKPVHQLGPGLFHTAPGGIPGGLVERARSICNNEHFVAFFQCRQRGEGHADVGHYASDQKLLFAGRLYCFDELLVIPAIDLARQRRLCSVDCR